jgi:hypothetical protein
MGACILCITQKIVVSMRKRDWKKPIFMPPRKVEKPNPAKNSFAQFRKKLGKLEKAIRNKASN